MKIVSFILLLFIFTLQHVKAQFPPFINLGNSQEDVRIISVENETLMGDALASGDLNNDGFDDLIIGAYGADGPDGLAVGNVYIVFGSDDLLPAFSINRPSENITIIYGDDEQDLTGLKVACADLNDDRYLDVIVGAPQLWKATVGGYVYIIWGRSEWPREINLNSNGKPIPGVTRIVNNRIPGVLGSSLETGDVNGDGITDLVMGDIAAGPHGSIGNEGQVYVLYGGGLLPEIIQLGKLAERMTTVQGIAEGLSQIGEFIGCLDIDDDGYWDVLIGDPSRMRGTSDPVTGRVYVIYGTQNLPRVIDLDSLSEGSVRSTEIIGEYINDFFGSDFAGGDVNGDGYQDVLIGTREWDPNLGEADGKMYVLFGPLPNQTIFDMRNYSNKTTILGRERHGFFGSYIACADVNKDGIDDIIAGAPYASVKKSREGKAWVIFGNKKFPAVLDLKKPVNASHTLQILGYQSYQRLGRPVHTGDINGDGISDIIVSAAQTYTPTSYLSGEVYIIYGRDQSSTPPSVEKPQLLQNYPNPFNNYTVITYQIDKGQQVSLKIYNSLGQEVRTLVNGWLEPGIYHAIWYGYNNNYVQTGNGIYFCRLKTKTFETVKKILHMK